MSMALNISIENAEMFLFRLFRAVLVSRETELTARSRKPCFAYKVNVRGSERLDYWKAKEEKAQELSVRSEERPVEEKPKKRKKKEVESKSVGGEKSV